MRLCKFALIAGAALAAATMAFATSPVSAAEDDGIHATIGAHGGATSPGGADYGGSAAIDLGLMSLEGVYDHASTQADRLIPQPDHKTKLVYFQGQGERVFVNLVFTPRKFGPVQPYILVGEGHQWAPMRDGWLFNGGVGTRVYFRESAFLDVRYRYVYEIKPGDEAPGGGMERAQSVLTAGVAYRF